MPPGVARIFATGDDGQDEIIARYLIARGVPAALIDLDPDGHRTRASMENAAAIGIEGIEDAIICTQRYPMNQRPALRQSFDRSHKFDRHRGVDRRRSPVALVRRLNAGRARAFSSNDRG